MILVGVTQGYRESLQSVYPLAARADRNQQ